MAVLARYHHPCARRWGCLNHAHRKIPHQITHHVPHIVMFLVHNARRRPHSRQQPWAGRCAARRPPARTFPTLAHVRALAFLRSVLAAPCPCRPRPCCTTHQALASSSDAHAKNTVSPTCRPHLGQPPLCRLALNSMTDAEGGPRTILPFSWYRAPAPAAAYCICQYFCSKNETAYCHHCFYARRRYLGRDGHGPWSR